MVNPELKVATRLFRSVTGTEVGWDRFGSPGKAGWACAGIGAGGAKYVDDLTGLLEACPPTATRGMPPARVPPILGGFNLYWACSRPLTTQPSPLNRAHSARRADVLSVPGAVRAPPMDHVSHNSKTTIRTPRRRTQKRRRPGREALCLGGGRCLSGPSTLRSASAVKTAFLLFQHRQPGRCVAARMGGRSGLPILIE